jgi:hypothetical protein
VWVEFEEGGKVFGERGKVWLEGSGRGGWVRGEGDGPVLVDRSGEGEGKVAANTFEVGCGNNREFGGPLFVVNNRCGGGPGGEEPSLCDREILGLL